MTFKPLVIGIGNVHRGDDGAGVAVLRRLPTHRTIEIRDSSNLVDLWDGEESVVIVDSVRSGRAPGSVVRFDGLGEDLPAQGFQSTHSFGLREAIGLGRVLNRLPNRLTVFGIEGTSYAQGSDMEPSVMRAVAEVAVEIAGM
jgi:hydrogenase maturation protease